MRRVASGAGASWGVMAGHREPTVRALIGAHQPAGPNTGILSGDRRSAGLQSWAGGAHGLRFAVAGAAFLWGFAARTIQVVIPQGGQGSAAMGLHLPRLGGQSGQEVLGYMHGAGCISPHGSTSVNGPRCSHNQVHVPLTRPSEVRHMLP